MVHYPFGEECLWFRGGLDPTKMGYYESEEDDISDSQVRATVWMFVEFLIFVCILCTLLAILVFFLAK